MAIKVQCEKCGSVMNIRETYAGTERTCPKCHHKFRVPEVSAGTDAPTSGTSPEASTEAAAAEEDFDAVAFLTGEKPAKGAAAAPKAGKSSKEKPSGKEKGGDAPAKKAGEKKPDDDFDPLDILSEGKPKPAPPKPAPSASDILKKGSPTSPAATSEPAATPAAAEEEFDPLAVLGTGPTPAAAPAPAAPEKPAEPEPYKPRRPSWAKPLPDDKPEPAAATPAAEPEKPAEAEPYKPRRPSWAKPLPGEEPSKPAAGTAAPGAAPSAAAALTAVAADASPAALAAAAAMGGQVQAKLPPEEKVEPRGPLFDKAAFVARIKRNLRLIAITVPTALVLFGISWRFVRPGYVPVPTLAPVSGVVTLDGQPLAGALVQYHPRSNQFRSPMAVTDAEGRYRLDYWNGQEGAPAARYRVQVQRLDKQGRDTIPPNFGQATRQEVTVRTDDKANSSYDIAIVTK